MPLLDIARAQPSLQSPLVSVRAQTLIHGQRLSNPWKSSTLPKRVNFHVGQPENPSAKLQIRAVATLEPKCSVSKEDEHKKSQLGVGSTPSTQLESFKPGDSDEELDEREKLRRRRISEANKGNTPWNKGRKHSAETLQRIRERTRLAMQNPKPAACTQSKQSPSNRKANETSYSSTSETITPIEQLRLRRKNKPLYKDPMSSSKLKMLKNIRAQRATEEMKKTEAVERARLLIAEAEKAAKALEVAAGKSPIARASLIETRKLIAEAIQSIESIEGGRVTYYENGGYIAVASDEPVSLVEKTMQSENSSLSQADQKEVNGNQFLSLSEKKDLSFPNFMLPRIVNGDGDEVTYPSSSNYSIPNLNLDDLIKKSDSPKQLNQLETNRIMNGTKAQVKNNSMAAAVTKKWVHGRLVEVAEGAS
ncbi:hypothetical protein V6N12_039994 [Hibiscus sabdariffa]|uniref:Nuclease associated modular domain-containing protein n=1 Tax=Hibiscus sabdariffa TaxID=183260 RepID=A0ABR2E3R8_9ROSI